MSVITNNYTGYTFSISAQTDDENSSKLVNGEYALNSITEAGSAASFNNGNWGYLPSKYNSEENTNYLPAPTFEGDVLDVTDAPNAEANTYSIVLGAKADYSLPSGDYNNTFVIAAIANPVHYTIDYNANTEDSVEGMPDAQAGETTETTVELSSNTPTRTGYTFKGWCSGNVVTSGGAESCDGVTYTPGGTYDMDQTGIDEVHMVAMWEVVNFTVSYTLNGGSATNPASYNVETNSFTLNNPTRTGYTFKGWSGTGLSGDTNQTVTINKGSTGNRSYTANWTVTTYTISYTLNSGSANNPTTYNIETASFTLTNPTRTGYTFKGWSGTGLSGDSNTSVTIPKGSTGTRSYTANWTIKSYSVQLNVTNGSGATTKTINHGSNATFAVSANTGYHYSSLSCTNSQSVSISGNTVTVSSVSNNTVCTLTYAANTYYIAYAGNGSTSGSMANTTCTYGSNCTLRSNAFGKTGYTFNGWTSGGKSYSNGQTVSNLTTTNGGTVTMTAQWKANTYTVTLNRNSGSGGSGSVTATYGSAMPAITKPTRTGYTFNGYYTATSGGTQYYNANGASVRNWDKTAATTLYAQWSLTWTKKTTYYWAYLGTTTNETTAVSMCNAVGGSVPYYWQMQNDLDGGSLWSLGGNSAGVYWTDDDYASGKTVVVQDNSSGYYTSSSPIDAGSSQYRVICRK